MPNGPNAKFVSATEVQNSSPARPTSSTINLMQSRSCNLYISVVTSQATGRGSPAETGGGATTTDGDDGEGRRGKNAAGGATETTTGSNA